MYCINSFTLVQLFLVYTHRHMHARTQPHSHTHDTHRHRHTHTHTDTATALPLIRHLVTGLNCCLNIAWIGNYRNHRSKRFPPLAGRGAPGKLGAMWFLPGTVYWCHFFLLWPGYLNPHLWLQGRFCTECCWIRAGHTFFFFRINWGGCLFYVFFNQESKYLHFAF